MECDFNVDLIGNFDATLGLVEHCLVLRHLVQHMEQELGNVVLLVLVLSKLFRQLTSHSHFLTL